MSILIALFSSSCRALVLRARLRGSDLGRMPTNIHWGVAGLRIAPRSNEDGLLLSLLWFEALPALLCLRADRVLVVLLAVLVLLTEEEEVQGRMELLQASRLDVGKRSPETST